MIVFRLTRQTFAKNTFFTKRTTPIAKTLNSFGYIKHITANGVAIVDWYDNFTKVELRFRMRELIEEYKSIYPYYNNPHVRGNIWKHSYHILLRNIHKDTGFSKIKVDKVVYKKTPNKGNKVLICDAQYVQKNNIDINKLEGKIIKIKNNTYEVITEQGKFAMNRNNFLLQPQDFFILLSVRCN